MTGPTGPGAGEDRPPPAAASDDGPGPGEAGSAGAPADADRPRVPEPPRARRFPGWLLIPLGGAAGWIVSDWMGAAFGCVVGLLIWRSRAG